MESQPLDHQTVGTGAVAMWSWSTCEEIPHDQGQRRSPRKTVDARAVAAQRWSDFEEIPHVQGQRNPSKMVGGREIQT